MNIGMFDQTKEALKDLAQLLRTHYGEMLAVGFTPEEALQLTIAFQQAMVSNQGRTN